VLGGQVPGILLASGHLDLYRGDRYGLITSEEDVIVTMMCLANRLKFQRLETHDTTWSRMNSIGEGVLTEQADAIPFVVHPLKATPEGLSLRARIHRVLPLFAER
jgi:hypothetical protein